MNLSDLHKLEDVVLHENAKGFEVETLAHYLIDGVYTKVFVAKKAGTFIGQHSHHWDHGTLVASGAVRVFINGSSAGDYQAGDMIEISGGKKHVLLALEDNTICACIHNAHGKAEPQIEEEAVFGERI